MNYSKLRAGDMVVCGGRGFSATLIKAATAGWENKFNKHISCHTGLVIEWVGQFFIAEMLGRGLSISPFKRYEKGNRWIIGIKRHPVYNNVMVRRDLIKSIELE